MWWCFTIADTGKYYVGQVLADYGALDGGLDGYYYITNELPQGVDLSNYYNKVALNDGIVHATHYYDAQLQAYVSPVTAVS